MDPVTFTPVGVVRCANRYKFEAARQGIFTPGNQAVIELFPGHDYETALSDLDGFERLWVLFVFDRNHDWKPKVSPPVTGTRKRYGVFATRSPHRPNPIGLSCVKLEKIDGLKLEVSGHDFLDGTPVLDLKPYIPAADAFPEAKAGWRDEVDASELPVDFSDDALRKMEFVKKLSGLDLKNFCEVQLCRAPTCADRKRIERFADGNYGAGCRTWQVIFAADDSGVQVKDVRSHYAAEELGPGADDPYGDKDHHRAFRREFGDGD
ncbi:MAG: tRNA (N6-threonylcarbamoyladenosine(37)-N6)-methyltransferase TrmO [Lentisphaeria bacterium]|nr:tRNA (N6-threonylcarbamoyladenosine(37)-N6)-methyltransferase TrmO [Lentisphaeria bacterium]